MGSDWRLKTQARPSEKLVAAPSVDPAAVATTGDRPIHCTATIMVAKSTAVATTAPIWCRPKASHVLVAGSSADRVTGGGTSFSGEPPRFVRAARRNAGGVFHCQS